MTRHKVRDLVAEGVLRVEDGNHGNDRPRPDEFVEVGVAFIRAADMTSGVVGFGNAGKINDVARRRIRKGVGAPGDVILSHKGTVGRVAVAPLDSPDFVCSPQTTFWRSLNEDVVDRRFLAYVLRSEDFQRQLAALAGQTDMAPYVSLTDQRSMTIELPPISSQRQIGQLLGALDDKIAANNRLIRITDKLAEARTLGALSGDEVQLSEAALIVMGSSPPGTSYNEQGEGIPFYQGVRDFGVRFPSRRVWTTSPVRLAEQGDTLVSVRAPVGRTNLARERMCLGRGVAGLRSKRGYAMTLFHQVRAASDVWAPFEAVGTVFGAINKGQLESIALPAIDHSQAERLETELVALEDQIAAALVENDRLAAARDELLPLLMSGKVRMRDPQKVVEGVA